ncbi:hypothetical protein GobsT_00350 [Gemmata obscuriglobus]|uniref:TIGR03067 domain-containing protein n=1 Tax=Gemmata obscuriglobus TaxID=114 RepID=A0A2Z3HC75_9BACT|nr:hypothetical protein [Gemmata obscuriglobus]AWM41336.1 hypothetical protein C1280_32960 [Gemmata obscuriglobus]QEG25311.1 hypothetical protein GobsT_00350 [Gemmata obscuriglobus]VTR98195.1 unnamed protein product [Gemmata obscuriglobus UQM 2246]
MHRTVAPLLLLLATGALAAEPEGDLKALQGVWVIENAKLGGRDHKDDLAGMKLTVTSEKYVIDFAENSDKGAVTLGEAQKPKQIDLTTRRTSCSKGARCRECTS